MGVASRRVVMTWFCAATVAPVACANGSVNPVSLSASPVVSSLAAPGATSASFPRSGAAHVTKQCLAYTGQAGDSCTIASSDLKEIEAGSRVVYAQAANFTTLLLDSDVVLDPPGSGNNKAFGHCHLNLATGLGRCTFSGGTGKFMHFDASFDVSAPTDGVNWHWDGTYSFSPQD
jgi:hypothetical protein